jgi:hypothetical protein
MRTLVEIIMKTFMLSIAASTVLTILANALVYLATLLALCFLASCANQPYYLDAATLGGGFSKDTNSGMVQAGAHFAPNPNFQPRKNAKPFRK